MNKWPAVSLLFGLFFGPVLSGCAVLVIGAAGAAGGYAVSADGIEGILDQSYDHLWRTAVRVLQREGMIGGTDQAHGEMKAKVGHSEVTLRLDQTTPKTVTLRVQARRAGGIFPDKNLAKRIYRTIVDEASQGKNIQPK